MDSYTKGVRAHLRAVARTKHAAGQYKCPDQLLEIEFKKLLSNTKLLNEF